MKFIRPTTVTAAMLISSNVTETPPAAYNAGTTYGDGDTASTGTAGGVITVWESLQAANTGHTPSSSPTWWAEIGTTYAAWDAGTTYAAGDIVLSATTHRIYESVQAANTNHNPTTDSGTWWLDAGPTNRWALFDSAVGTVTARPTPITIDIAPGIVNTLALLDIVAGSVQVQVKNAAETVTYYDQTFTMEDGRYTMGWWEYYFAPLSPQTTLVVTNLPPVDGHIIVTLSGGAAIVVGTLAVGALIDIGATLANPSVGIIDYSRKTTDDFGVTSVIERAYAKKIEARFYLHTSKADYVAAQLAGVRATPVVWLADDGDKLESLIAFGFYRDWGIDIVYATHSEASITIEGLT